MKIKNTYRLLFLMIIPALFSYSQESNTDDIAYLDINEKPTNKENASYYEFKTNYKEEISKYQKYFIVNSTKAQLIEKYFYDIDLNKQGKYVKFRKDGSKVSEGYYTDNLKHGPWKRYLKQSSDSIITIDTYLYTKTVFQNDKKSGEFKEYYQTGLLRGEGQYKNNEFVGECKWYHRNMKLSSLEIYNEKGKIIEITQWNENGDLRTKRVKPNNDLSSQKKAIQSRVIKMINDIKKNYKNINGKIRINLKVDTEGKLILFQIYNSPEIPNSFIVKLKNKITNDKKRKPIYYHNQKIGLHLTIRANILIKRNLRTTTRKVSTTKRIH